MSNNIACQACLINKGVLVTIQNDEKYHTRMTEVL